MTGMLGNDPVKTDSTSTGRWLGADCGKVK
jgi:hypothetical protein